jgi:hypothetical protein
LGGGHIRPLRADAPKAVERPVGEAGEEQPERIGQHSLSARSVGEEHQLLLLDPILHIATLKIDVFVETLGFPGHPTADGTYGLAAEVLGDVVYTVQCPNAKLCFKTLQQARERANEPLRKASEAGCWGGAARLMKCGRTCRNMGLSVRPQSLATSATW